MSRSWSTSRSLDRLGRRLGERTVPTGSCGLTQLLGWAREIGAGRVWGVEGTGGYGAGLARRLRSAGEVVREVSRPAPPSGSAALYERVRPAVAGQTGR